MEMKAAGADQPVTAREPRRRFVASLLYGRNVDRTAKTRARLGLAVLIFVLGYAIIAARLVMFAAAPEEQQLELIQAVQDRGSGDWHGLNAAHVWSLWTRYACTALYAHPLAWDEIGFPGPAYPRGYKNAGVDKLEPFEVRDARPSRDPIREGA